MVIAEARDEVAVVTVELVLLLTEVMALPTCEVVFAFTLLVSAVIAEARDDDAD